MKCKIIFLSVFVLLCMSESVFAWDGYDYDSGNHVEIERDSLVRRGNEIEYYDHEDGEYKYGDVESVRRYGTSVEVEVYDHDSGEYRTFEMDGN